MTEKELVNRYIRWMYKQVYNENYIKNLSYKKLFHYLNTIDFEYDIPMDENRAEDGINLRYRFGDEFNYTESMIALYLDNKKCSVLEMIVALAIRCEVHIMANPDFGNQTGKWFWQMISNLGLDSMTDNRFDSEYIDEVIDRFLNHRYKSNGEGGLFYIRDSKKDLRTAEIWYQMNWYLESII